MDSIIFTCETITPMFMSGSDGLTPELRAPSIKGALRFWWRAINGHLSLEDKKDGAGKVIEKGLRTIEGDIFGSTNQRSNVVIIVREQPTDDDIELNALLPHKSNSSRPQSYKIRTQIIVELKLVKSVDINNKAPFDANNRVPFDFEALRKLFVAVCALGGFGKRSRRGMGSVTIREIKKNSNASESYLMPQNMDEILELLPPQYFFKNERDNRIESRFGKNEKYPFIKQIQVGYKQSSLTLKIADVTNRFHKDIKYANNYGPSLGKAIGGRFASPIYVSTMVDTVGNNYPVITTLNTVLPSTDSRGNNNRDKDNISLPLQEAFKKAIL